MQSCAASSRATCEPSTTRIASIQLRGWTFFISKHNFIFDDFYLSNEFRFRSVCSDTCWSTTGRSSWILVYKESGATCTKTMCSSSSISASRPNGSRKWTWTPPKEATHQHRDLNEQCRSDSPPPKPKRLRNQLAAPSSSSIHPPLAPPSLLRVRRASSASQSRHVSRSALLHRIISCMLLDHHILSRVRFQFHFSKVKQLLKFFEKSDSELVVKDAHGKPRDLNTSRDSDRSESPIASHAAAATATQSSAAVSVPVASPLVAAPSRSPPIVKIDAVEPANPPPISPPPPPSPRPIVHRNVSRLRSFVDKISPAKLFASSPASKASRRAQLNSMADDRLDRDGSESVHSWMYENWPAKGNLIVNHLKNE